MANEEDPNAPEATRVAGAFLGPGGTFPAELHTLSDLPPTDNKPEAASRRLTPVSAGWATALAVAFWAVGSIVLAIGIGAVLALTDQPKPSEDGAALLGYLDLLLLIPAALVGIRLERIWGVPAFAIVLVAAGVAAVAATLALELTPFILGGSLAIAVAWSLTHARR